MRRWFFGGCVLVILAIASVYFFIPSKLVVSKIVLVQCNANGADRVLGDTGGWVRWWPGGEEGVGRQESSVRQEGNPGQNRVKYVFSGRLLKAVQIVIQDKGEGRAKDLEIPSVLTIFPLINKDSSFLQWEFTLNASVNPFKRIGQYQECLRLKDSMGVILSGLRDYLEKRVNVYGITIHEGVINGSVLEEGSWTVGEYPGTDTIYKEVKKLEQFITAHGQPVMGHPMVNVTPMAGGLFQLRVALATNKPIPNSGNIQYRNLPTGKFLYADIRGGEGVVRAAFGQMNNYVSDNGRTMMAIPFFSLITDRRTEADTTKWATRIYYPIL